MFKNNFWISDDHFHGFNPSVIVHSANLALHVLDVLLQQLQLSSETDLIFLEIVGILLHSLEQRFIVQDGFVHAFGIFVKIALVDKFEIVKIAVDTFIGLLIFKFDVIKEFKIIGDFLVDWFEEELQSLNPRLHAFHLIVLHVINNNLFLEELKPW